LGYRFRYISLPSVSPRSSLTIPITESDASETSSIASDDDLASETIYDRIVALQDILPPSQRRFVASTVSNTTAWVKTGFSLAGKGLWIFSTSALLIGIPWAMAYQEEVQMIEMEKEMRMQQAASEVCFNKFLFIKWCINRMGTLMLI
jgi:mitochondrial import receptor subunit TOM22